VPLFIQENYLKTIPARSRNYDGPEKALKELRLMDQAASSISDGDIVDAMIHGCVSLVCMSRSRVSN
jgi:replication factor C subunit 1